jgi:Transposase DDE domain group 1
VRRIYSGGKRGDGHRRRQRIRRPHPASIRVGRPDPNLTGVAGLVSFGVYLRKVGIDQQLREGFFDLKSGPRVVYPMEANLRILLDAFSVGESRVFGIEGLASDALFVHLDGGVVPSIDTLYRDLARFDEPALTKLESMMAEQGLSRVSALRGTYVHMDVDTTVLPLFGEHEGARPGPNSRYHDRPSFHPILARVAETDTIVGAHLRPGDTGFGAVDVLVVRAWAARARERLHDGVSLCVRMDSGGDCAALMQGLHEERVFYLIKGSVTPNLFGAIAQITEWKTTDVDADLAPIRQVAELDFARTTWSSLGHRVRVIVVRSLERQDKQMPLFDGLDWTVQVFLTNRIEDADDIAWDYDGRAGIEAHIGDLKQFWGIAEAAGHGFSANHAAFLLKLLSHNLVDRYAHTMHPGLPHQMGIRSGSDPIDQDPRWMESGSRIPESPLISGTYGASRNAHKMDHGNSRGGPQKA